MPLGADPQECLNEITPNDMYSSTECAWSGAFIVAGGLSAALWVFIRAFSMHLQICWDIIPGRRFFYGAQAFGWGIPAILFAATITATGVSFRFGKACHVTHEHSIADFWGPLLAFAAASVVLQLATFGYCIHVYLRNLWSEGERSETNASGTDLPPYSGSINNGSIRTQAKTRAVWQRLKKVLWLQWRGLVIVSIILTDVVFFSVVFVYLDDLTSSIKKDFSKVAPWITCLAQSGGNKTLCYNEASHFLVGEPTVVAVILLLSLTGIEVTLLLVRPEMFTGWVEFLRNKFSSRQEFVSLDAIAQQQDTTALNRSNSNRPGVGGGGVYNYKAAGTAFEMQKPIKDFGYDLDFKTLSPSTMTSMSSPDQNFGGSPYFGGAQIHHELDASTPVAYTRDVRLPEYVGHGQVRDNSASRAPSALSHNPSILSHGTHGRATPTDPFSSRANSLSRSNSITNNNNSSNRGYRSATPESGSRRYRSPIDSFSQPSVGALARQASLRSQRSTRGAPLQWDAREMYARGGLALNPPSESGENVEDMEEVSIYGTGNRL